MYTADDELLDDGNFYFQECEDLIEELDANSKAALLEYQKIRKEFHEAKIATTPSEKEIFKLVDEGEIFKILFLLKKNPDLAKNTTVVGNNIIHLLVKKGNLVDIQELLREKELRSLLLMKNIKDQTPLQLAKHIGQKEIYGYLRNFMRDNGLTNVSVLPRLAGILGGAMLGARKRKSSKTLEKHSVEQYKKVNREMAERTVFNREVREVLEKERALIVKA